MSNELALIPSRVVRGGSWIDNTRFALVTSRHALKPARRFGFLGVRLVRRAS